MTATGKKALNIAIVGAGVAGLATAVALRSHGHGTHTVTVFERYAECKPIGGPVGIGPNASCLLIDLGMREEVEKCVPKLHSILNAYRYDDGTRLRSVPAESTKDVFGAPFWTISRYQLLRVLLDRASSLGVAVLFNKRICDIDTEAEQPVITVENGETHQYDLVIAADGIQSQVRAKFLGRKIQPASPLTAYNINVPRSALAADPELEFLLGHSGGWFGPHRFIMAMDMPDYNDYSNFCFCSEKGNGKEGEWFIKGDIRSVRAQFSDFEPRIQKILALADPEACYLWSLSDIPTLETWRSKSGKAILIGDAAHAVLPYAGMGAGSAIEDALCLAECLGRVRSSAADMDLRAAVAAFEAIRKPRTTFTAVVGRADMKYAHLPDGPEQEARDDLLRSPAMPSPPAAETNTDVHEPEDYNPPTDGNTSITPEGRDYLSAYNVLKHTRTHLANHGLV